MREGQGVRFHIRLGYRKKSFWSTPFRERRVANNLMSFFRFPAIIANHQKGGQLSDLMTMQIPTVASSVISCGKRLLTFDIERRDGFILDILW
jgi:hypothetical protein